jgi:hypothetical protein
MSRPTRIVLITLALIVAGAICGGIAGALALALGVAIADRPNANVDIATDLWLLRFPAYVGAVLGAVALPSVAWLLLRRVSLGRAIMGSVLGTVVGGALGWIPAIGWDRVYLAIGASFLGFLGAAVVMRRRANAAAAHGDEAAA